MERDPFRFAWRVATAPNAALVALAIVVGVPLLWIALDIVGLAIDSVVPGQAAQADPARFFLRYTIHLPERIREEPIVVLPGLALSRPSFVLAVIGGFVGAVVAAAAICFGLRRLSLRAGERIEKALAHRILSGIATAPVPAGEQARVAASFAGDAVGRERESLDTVGVKPIVAVAVILMGIAYVAVCSWAAGGALVVALALQSIALRRRSDLDEMRAAAAAFASSALRRSLNEVARNLTAVTVHGTALREADRVEAVLEGASLPRRKLSDRAAVLDGLAAAAAILPLAIVVATEAWVGLDGSLSPGTVGSAALAAGVATAAVAAISTWRTSVARLRPIFDEMGRAVGAFHSRRQDRKGGLLPVKGTLNAEDLATAPTATGRLVHADIEIGLPSHVALLGGPGSGARSFAGILGGTRLASAGSLTFGGVALEDASPEDRAQKLAFAGGPTYLFAGCLRDNLLYGADPNATDDALLQAVTVAGFDGVIERRGLSGSIDPRREPALAAAVVEARDAIRAALEASDRSDLIEPFRPDQYNPHATIGENILFGVALGDTFRGDHLPSQPFMRSLLDREGLTKPLTAIGADIARRTLEMFGDLPSDGGLLGRFSLIAPEESETFERILRARDDGRRRTGSGDDVEKLIGVALGYCEPRHRFGLMGPELRERVVRLRRAFAETIPKSLEPAVDFFREGEICPSASVRDNLLFGRVAHDRAGAEDEISACIRDVLRRLDLGRDLAKVALLSRIDPQDHGMNAPEISAVDVIRCLMREPDNLVIEHALDGLSGPDARALVSRLKDAMVGRGLIVCLARGDEMGLATLFDRAISFESGRRVNTEPTPLVTAPMPA